MADRVARQLVAIFALDTEFEESDHPRGEGGKFSSNPDAKVTAKFIEKMLDHHKIEYRKEHSTSNSASHGPSASQYYHAGGKTIRLSDHSYSDPDVDLRYHEAEPEAEARIARALNLPVSEEGQKVRDRQEHAVAASQAKEAEAEAAREKVRQNSEMLEAAGFGNLTGKARKRALKKLRGDSDMSAPAFGHAICAALKRGKDESFEKVENSLAHRKGVHDPRALAAWIGRRSMGKAAFQAKAAAARKG